MMAGLEKPKKGIICIKGKAVEKMTEKQLAKFHQDILGYVFHSYNLLPMLTVLAGASFKI